MIHGKGLIIVMPADNATSTVEKAVADIPSGYIDEIILVDDFSRDHTFEIANKMGLHATAHPQDRGYGGNQKTCYQEALKLGADVVVMLQPDYQYTPKLVVAMESMIATAQYDIVVASRILCGSAIRGGMPVYKYVFNRLLTLFQYILMHTKVSEFHTGCRAFSRDMLEKLPLDKNCHGCVFDNEMWAQARFFGFCIGENSCPTRYRPESSSISFRRSGEYGFGVLRTSMAYRLARWGPLSSSIFSGIGGN